ncbi:PepSY-associated TM helix domain-containing protein [Uliginosibacterium sp. TH139]|uniref:PepSY-associated TM helix domain-containing protein n=1 Tax=Uliginosibacterium sp. TH139 TaxID=2067453 RepID=UPI000C7E3A25|nr:PepSY-associated TM helix domain-containing protein [Uliginosibacterium sp. TH139]PLK49663.1 peptidase [Uliginosibacterium sp. TH139]
MRSDYIRIYKTVHTWTGILTGMALFIAFYAGALTVFKEPLARWAAAPVAALEVPLAETPALIAKTLAAHPGAAKGFQLNLKPAEHEPARLSWVEREEGQDDHDTLNGRHYRATLDAQGNALISESQPSQLAEFIDILHRVVGLPFDTDPNRWLMGVVAALYALALVSGVIVLLPTLVKDFFALRLGKNLKRMWLDAHNVVGIISLPFHIVMAITAVVFAYHDGLYALQDKYLHSGRLANAFNQQRPAAKPAPRDPADMLPPVTLLERAQALSPGFEPSSLQYVNLAGPRAMVRVWGSDPAALAPRAMGGFVALDPWSGKVLSRDFLPGAQDAANTTLSSFFALHFATFGGTPVRWMYFLLALAGAWLFYSGNLLWIESRRKKQRQGEALPGQRLDTRLLASATVGVCIGCIAGVSLTIACAKWLHGHVADLNAWHWYVYYGVFFASLAWAFWRGAGRAVVPLLWLAALATFCIPLTTLLAWLIPGLGLWASSSLAALGVDLTALAGGLGLVWMARATARRVRLGADDSVWSARPAEPTPASAPAPNEA